MSDRRAGHQFFADALMALGALMTLLCGGCTVFFLGTAIWAVLMSVVHHSHLSAVDRENLGVGPVMGLLATIIGGLPTAVGIALFIIGRGLKRRVIAPLRSNPDATAPSETPRL